LIAALTAQSCTLFSPPPLKPTVDVTGFWEGNSVGSCQARMARCGAVEIISLSMIQNDAQITGMYRCATGNEICRNLNTNGRIAVGSVRGRAFRSESCSKTFQVASSTARSQAIWAAAPISVCRAEE
jgi:hypothetical protein